MLVVGEGVPGLGGQEAGPVGQLGVESVTSMPPPLVVMILLPLKENTPAVPNDPAGRPR